MNKILVVILTVLFSFSAKAEYNGYHISFTIEKVNGQKIKGYAYIAAAYLNLDSLQNTKYLKKALDQDRQEDWADRKSLTYYKSRIVYNYTSVFDQQSSHEYYLTEEATLGYKSIKKITVDDMIDWSYLSGMTVLKTSDLTWLDSKPAKSYALSAFLCDYQLFVHENNKKIDTIIGRAQSLMEELALLEHNISEQQSNGSENDEIEAQLDEIHEKIDDEISKAIKQLEGYNIVIVSFCTC